MAMRGLSLKHKVQLFTVLTALLTALVCVGYISYREWREYRSTSVASLCELSQMLADHSGQALAAQDAATLGQDLRLLRAHPEISAARILAADGRLLACYPEASAGGAVAAPDKTGAGEDAALVAETTVDWSSRTVEIARPVDFEGRTVGFLGLTADLSRGYAVMVEDIAFAAGVISSMLILSLLLALRLQAYLARPIGNLARTMEEVSSCQDYSLRVPVSGNDELAMLARMFNDMLCQVELRDRRLAEHTSLLEEEVAQRTSDLKQMADEAHRLAYFDNLTGLPNRRMLIDQFDAAVKEAASTNSAVALLFLDLDRFKRINDTLGHHIGDDLLIAVAERIKHCLRTCDTVSRINNSEPACISRLGGDEFVVFLTGLTYPQQSGRVAHRLIQAIRQPISVQGYSLTVTTSIGISLFPEDGSDVASLLKHADTAMYHAKEKGKNTYQFYNSSLNATALNRLALENDLRVALEQEQFVVHFQPKFDTLTKTLTGAEALVRWEHPEKGMIYPADFIPVAEESGLIVQLGHSVLQQVCRNMAIWDKMGLAMGVISINLSGYQFIHPNMVANIADVLVATNIDPRFLQIELTESMLMDTSGTCLDILNDLKSLGLQLAIDDFGKGYSSLSYLKSFPIDVLKIDRSFICELPADSHNAAITRAIVIMAHSLGLKVIAEGVERKEHYDFLRELGCNEVQGFLFARPLPAPQFTSFMENLLPRENHGDNLIVLH